MSVTLDFTEKQSFTALRDFLVSIVPTGLEVIQGQINRVPTPKVGDFLVFWPLSQNRLGTNVTTYQDNVVIGSIAGTMLTVTSVTRGQLAPGMSLFDKSGVLPVLKTEIVAQLHGSVGLVGTYLVSVPQTISSATLYAGVRDDLVPTEWTVQLDIHGPNSGNNARIFQALFRSEYGTQTFSSSGFDVTPLYADDIRQLPFMGEAQQYENRWSVDVHLQINPVVGTPQQFADELQTGFVDVEAEFP